MIPVRWTPKAISDLEEISLFIERQRNLDSANRICRKIYDSIQSLRRFPESGRPGIEAGTRELVMSPLPYLAIYRILPGTIHILRIWHGARNRAN